MSDNEYAIKFSKGLLDSGALQSVQLDFRKPESQPGEAQSSWCAQSDGMVSDRSRECYTQLSLESATLSMEPAYYTCLQPDDHPRERGKLYVVTRGVQPGIYYCWTCAKHEGKGAHKLPPNTDTYCEKKFGDAKAREFWRREHGDGKTRCWIPRSMYIYNAIHCTS
ncbi:unnamed protein product [Peniophora sp. CBMAI 1063]|nr:unnamed protein product [Peniophora sp. CBMAI 1063]